MATLRKVLATVAGGVIGGFLTCGQLFVPVSAQPAASASPSRAPIKLDRIVAVVNDEAITESELQMRIAVTERQFRRQNQPLPDRTELARQILERMILDRSLIQHAREKGIRAEDVYVEQALARIAAENRVPLSGLRERVERDGMSFERFREDVRDEITVARLREREVESKVQVSEAEIDRLLAEQSNSADTTEYNIAQILLRVPENASPEVVERQRLRAQEIVRQLERGTDFARLAAAFSDAPEAMNGGNLGWRTAERLPQLFLDAVRQLRPNQVAPVLRSGNGFHVLRLLDVRSTGVAGNNVPVNQTRASHILLRATDEASEREARGRLTALLQRIRSGAESFEAAARANSLDGSASNGGDLGWILPGDTVPEFERAMNETGLNQISEPFRTQFGLHIVLVKERKTAPPPTERIRAQARQVIRERKAEQQYGDWVQLIRDRAYVEYRNQDS